jgi:outer membrane lipoprotein-sorting protein
MNDSQEPRDDVLGRLTDAFVAQAVPPGPTDAVKQRLIGELERQPNRSVARRPERPWRRWTMLKTMSVAAVLLVMVAVGGYFSGGHGGSGNVFAAMIDRINEIRSVRFSMELDADEADKIPAMQSTITSVPPWTRQETVANGLKVVRITNSEQHKTLTLFEGLKTATLGESKGPEAKRTNFVDGMRQLPKAGAEDLGKDQIGGAEAQKFRYQHKGDYYTVWIDPASKLPIRVLMMNKLDPSAATIKVTFSKFEWNVPFDAELYTLEPPAGYAVSSNSDK